MTDARVQDVHEDRARAREFFAQAKDFVDDADTHTLSAPSQTVLLHNATVCACDATLQGVLTGGHRPKVFTSKRPHSLGTFLVDGTVAGGWWHRGDRVEVEPWEPIADATRRELNEEAARLARFMP